MDSYIPALPSSSSDQDGPTDTRGLSLAAIGLAAWGSHHACATTYLNTSPSIQHFDKKTKNTIFIQSV